MITDWSPLIDYRIYYDYKGETFVSENYPTYKDAKIGFKDYVNNPKYTNIMIIKSTTEYMMLQRVTGGH